MRGHGFEGVDVADGCFVLRCECGWGSHPGPDAASVGYEWDDHRAADVPVEVSGG